MPKVKKPLGRTVDCPNFDPKETNYEQWKKEAQVWRMVTNLPKSKQGSTLFLAMRGKAKDAVFQIDTAKLGLQDGFEFLIQTLDEIYLPEIFEKKYRNFKGLWNFSRKPNDSVLEWAGDWHAKFINYERVAGVLPSETTAMMFITAANLTSEQRQQTRLSMGTSITYAKVREIIKIQFAAEDEGKQEGLEAKREQDDLRSPSENETLWGRDSSRGRRDHSSGRWRSRGRYRPRPYRSYDRNRGSEKADLFRGLMQKKMNPTRNGNTMACNCCGSKYHLIRNCPDYARTWREVDNTRDTEKKYAFNYFMVYMGGQEEGELQSLLEECKGYAILDCGCPKTVCGEKWMKDYIRTLSEEDQHDIKISPSKQSFTFGDGRAVKANRRMRIPVWMGGDSGSLTTDVVESNIPLLLSINVMEKACMILDFQKAEVRVNGKIVRLRKIKSGHYAMPLSL